MNTATRLHTIAERLRGIIPDSPKTAERYIGRHTGDACRLIQPHWQTIVERAGINWAGDGPFPADEYRDPGTDADLWAFTWRTVASLIWSKLRGNYHPGIPDFKLLASGSGVTVSTATDNAEHWRETADDYAEILDAVAGWLSEESGRSHLPSEQSVSIVQTRTLRRMEQAAAVILEAGWTKTPEEPAGKPAVTTSIETNPAGQRKRRTKPRMPLGKVQEHWQEVLASGNKDLIQDYLTLAEIKLAIRIGCSRNTLRKCEGFQNRGIALREFNRENG